MPPVPVGEAETRLRCAPWWRRRTRSLGTDYYWRVLQASLPPLPPEGPRAQVGEASTSTPEVPPAHLDLGGGRGCFCSWGHLYQWRVQVLFVAVIEVTLLAFGGWSPGGRVV